MKVQVGPFEDVLVDYLHYLTVERGLSANTKHSYQQDLVQFFQYLIVEKYDNLASVDRFIIMTFLGQLEQKGKSRNTVIRMVSTLRKFFEFAQLNKLITSNPMEQVDSPKRHNTYLPY